MYEGFYLWSILRSLKAEHHQSVISTQTEALDPGLLTSIPFIPHPPNQAALSKLPSSVRPRLLSQESLGGALPVPGPSPNPTI